MNDFGVLIFCYKGTLFERGYLTDWKRNDKVGNFELKLQKDRI